ncbi:hypothetical protein [Hymenobacter metallilatus]|uniref:Uncharacterized protein n=1 Tax=Hymenobacter metallilatus TaxID=2493666 RepID=A0A3R9N0Q9_9BACT|nr:hypothetical protein [Hymenobacter metallilatus]RSK35514.1 hypothetical protein EI290_07395 [Hymenobacter metallilatus]
MNTGSLQILTWDIADSTYSFEVTICFQQLATKLDFYAECDIWRQFGRELQTFPLSLTHEVTLQIQQAEMALELTAFCYDNEGHAALRVMVNDNRVQPGPYRLEFAIPTDIGGLNELGRKLAGWSLHAYDEFYGEFHTS